MQKYKIYILVLFIFITLLIFSGVEKKPTFKFDSNTVALTEGNESVIIEYDDELIEYREYKGKIKKLENGNFSLEGFDKIIRIEEEITTGKKETSFYAIKCKNKKCMKFNTYFVGKDPESGKYFELLIKTK